MSELPLPSDRPLLARRVRLQTDPVTGDPVLLFPEGILVLNDTAHAIVSRCDGVVTVDGIVESLAKEYEAAGDDLRPDVLECLRDLRERNLLALQP